MFSKEVLIKVLVGLIRYGLIGASTWMVDRGIATPDQIELFYFGIATAVGTILWMWRDKIWERILLLTGLKAPEGTSVDKLKEKVAEGVYVPASTPNDAEPRLVRDLGSVKPPTPTALMLIPFLLAGAMMACAGNPTPSPGPGPTPTATPAPVDNRQAVLNKAAEIASATKAASKIANQVYDDHDALQRAGKISRAAMLKISDAANKVSRAGLEFVTFADTVSTDLSLRVAATALMDTFKEYIDAISIAGVSGQSIRAALEVLFSYLGVK